MPTTTSSPQATATELDSPAPLPAEPAIGLPPASLGYRLKCKVLGNPMHTEQLEHERLGKPTALAVFASDNLSSSAYATEEILHILVPAIGLAAFSLVMPITLALLVVLAFLILSYRETIKAYPGAGGAYLVTRDNFGHRPAQIAGAALLTDYVLTVAVSMSAGTAALVSAFDALAPYRVPISLLFIAVVAFGNLRGVRESGRIFAAPTYFFIVTMTILLTTGLVRYFTGDLPVVGQRLDGMIEFGDEGAGLLLGASAFIVLKAYASGGAAVTGVEAISNGVPAFRRPEWRNARQTLVIMGCTLGAMFLGLSFLASKIKVAPFHEGTPTVVAQIAETVYGDSALGQVLFYGLQAGTMLILVLAANTGFADFPRLASFQAADRFLPRQLTIRGHRLVYSNGIVALAAAASLLVIVTGAEVTQLIPLYAVGVFTGFTLSQSGMTRHHLREREPGWRRGIAINGFGAVLSFVVLVVIATTKFADGAWLILVTLPVLVLVFLRVNRQYEHEGQQLEHNVPEAIAAPLLRRHVVLVFIDRLDLAAVRAIQYARTLFPDELRAVHFVIDQQVADEIADAWSRYGLTRIALDLTDSPDRRLTRAAVEVVARDLADGETEVSVLLPDRKYSGFWHRILHDQTADAIEREISRFPHANVTTVPFHFTSRKATQTAGEVTEPTTPTPTDTPRDDRDASEPATAPTPPATPNARTPIADVHWRQRVTIEGRIRTIRVQPLSGATSLECVIGDNTGTISIVFLGRSKIGGIEVGTHLRAHGIAGQHHGRLAILNPTYQLQAR
ncbi:MAG: amino acid permease [Acidimicrobiales bacterium]